MFGLHPALKPLLPMWQSGSFGAVQAVGLPVPNRSHFAAMEAVEDADAGSSARVGWLNRMVGLIEPGVPQQGLQLGSTMLPTALTGLPPAVSARQLADFRLPGGDDDAARPDARRVVYALG